MEYFPGMGPSASTSTMNHDISSALCGIIGGYGLIWRGFWCGSGRGLLWFEAIGGTGTLERKCTFPLLLATPFPRRLCSPDHSQIPDRKRPKPCFRHALPGTLVDQLHEIDHRIDYSR